MSESLATHSCFYEGAVWHQRLRPKMHEFRMRVMLCYLDLAELPTLLDRLWLWSRKRPAIVRYRRSDYHGPADVPLEEAVRDTVQTRSGIRPTGPIRLLTALRQFGYGFNPVSFYYCYDEADEQLECVLAEITNTPWGERRAYVLPVGRAEVNGDTSRSYRYRFRKDFHISPFLPHDLEYDWRFSTPGEQLKIAMRVDDEQGHLFDASLALKRQAFSPLNRAWSLLRYPCLPAAVVARIHWEAARLWRKKIPVVPHPQKVEGGTQAETCAAIEYLTPPAPMGSMAAVPATAVNKQT